MTFLAALSMLALLLAPAGDALAASGARRARRPSLATAAMIRRVVARRAFNRELGETILTTTRGLTLYTLSAESGGRFICAERSCLAEWHPLRVPDGAVPAGPVALGSVRRPDGSLQVTYGGRPLYTFAGDRASGQAKGEGVKDVGTWHAAALH